jgi:threonine/homoserine/homoserine lactone efflux protein
LLPWLIFSSFVGGIVAYAILITVIGARMVYQRHELAITRICGVIFIGFAINALLHAVPRLLANKT